MDMLLKIVVMGFCAVSFTIMLWLPAFVLRIGNLNPYIQAGYTMFIGEKASTKLPLLWWCRDYHVDLRDRSIIFHSKAYYCLLNKMRSFVGVLSLLLLLVFFAAYLLGDITHFDLLIFGILCFFLLTLGDEGAYQSKHLNNTAEDVKYIEVTYEGEDI